MQLYRAFWWEPGTVIATRLNIALTEPGSWIHRTKEITPAENGGLNIQKPTSLRLVVNGLAFELLPVRVCSVDGDRARFAIRRDGDLPCPTDLSILHHGDVVGPVVYHFVGDGVIRQIPFYRVGFPIEL